MAQHEYAPAKAQLEGNLTGEDISTDVITGANNVDEALGVLDDAIATNNDHIATIQSSLPRYKGKGSYSSATYWGAVGFITGSGKNLYIQIPMIIAPDVTSITITECKIGLRTPSGGYLVSSDFNITSYITTKYAAREQGLIEIETEKSDQWGVANNSIVCGTVTMTFTLA